MSQDYEDRIRQRAHSIWENEGRPDGRHWEHWQRAREELENGHHAAPSPTSGLVGGDDSGSGLPDAIGVDDVASERASDPADNRPTTGRSKLVGT